MQALCQHFATNQSRSATNPPHKHRQYEGIEYPPESVASRPITKSYKARPSGCGFLTGLHNDHAIGSVIEASMHLDMYHFLSSCQPRWRKCDPRWDLLQPTFPRDPDGPGHHGDHHTPQPGFLMKTADFAGCNKSSLTLPVVICPTWL